VIFLFFARKKAATVTVRAGDGSWTAGPFAVHDHHYALVSCEGLEPGTITPYSNAAGFAQSLRDAAKGAKEPVIAISADAAATHQSVINVMEAARLAGYNHISFTTQTRR